MERKITKRQTMSLLRRIQHFQLLDGGKHSIDIRVIYDECDGKVWFAYCGFDGE